MNTYLLDVQALGNVVGDPLDSPEYWLRSGEKRLLGQMLIPVRKVNAPAKIYELKGRGFKSQRQVVVEVVHSKLVFRNPNF